MDACRIYGRQLYGKGRETIDPEPCTRDMYSGCVLENNKVVSGETETSPRRKVATAVLKNDPL